MKLMQFIQYQKCFHRDAPDIILCFRWIMQSDGLKQKFIFWHYLFLLLLLNMEIIIMIILKPNLFYQSYIY